MHMAPVSVVLEAPPDTSGWILAPGPASVEKTLAVPWMFQLADELSALHV